MPFEAALSSTIRTNFGATRLAAITAIAAIAIEISLAHQIVKPLAYLKNAFLLQAFREATNIGGEIIQAIRNL